VFRPLDFLHLSGTMAPANEAQPRRPLAEAARISRDAERHSQREAIILELKQSSNLRDLRQH
jgi:hypothetical protein